MNPLTTPPSNTEPVDEDLAEQANPGHGIPSQDPDAAAQTPLEPYDAEREANSVLMGGGMVAGAATGVVAGALGGAAAGATANSENSDSVGTAPADTVHPHAKDNRGGQPVVQPSIT